MAANATELVQKLNYYRNLKKKGSIAFDVQSVFDVAYMALSQADRANMVNVVLFQQTRQKDVSKELNKLAEYFSDKDASASVPVAMTFFKKNRLDGFPLFKVSAQSINDVAEDLFAGNLMTDFELRQATEAMGCHLPDADYGSVYVDPHHHLSPQFHFKIAKLYKAGVRLILHTFTACFASKLVPTIPTVMPVYELDNNKFEKRFVRRDNNSSVKNVYTVPSLFYNMEDCPLLASMYNNAYLHRNMFAGVATDLVWNEKRLLTTRR